MKRNYSMANNPVTEKELRFNVRIALPPPNSNAPAGVGSTYVFNLKKGDIVKLAGPFGDFRIKKSDREMVYLGGGAGMAPLRSQLSYLFETEKTKRKVSFWYGARTSAEIYYDQYFNTLQQANGNFSFHLALSEPTLGENWIGHTGFVHEVLQNEYLKSHKNPQDIEYYLCGPPAMITAGLKMLDTLGVPTEMISFDEF